MYEVIVILILLILILYLSKKECIQKNFVTQKPSSQKHYKGAIDSDSDSEDSDSDDDFDALQHSRKERGQYTDDRQLNYTLRREPEERYYRSMTSGKQQKNINKEMFGEEFEESEKRQWWGEDDF